MAHACCDCLSRPGHSRAGPADRAGPRGRPDHPGRPGGGDLEGRERQVPRHDDPRWDVGRYGAVWGGFWGLLFGLLFFIPFAGLAIGAGFGALFGHLGKNAIDEEFQDQVRDQVKPGTSALFMIIEQATPDKAIASLSKYGGTVIKTSLSDEDTAKLQEALAPKEPAAVS